MSEIFDYEWDEEPVRFLERGLEEYLDSLFDSVLEGWDGEQELETKSGDPFCGCEICYMRETIAYVLPRIVTMWEKGQVRRRQNGKVLNDLHLVHDGWVMECEGEPSK